MSRTLSLRRGDLSLELLPDRGGAVGAFRLGGADLMRPAPMGATVLDASCFPLVPFSNRIKDGCFSFRGREYRLQPNLPGHPHPLHGHGWRGKWDVVHEGDHSASLAFRRAGEDLPSAYAAQQHFELDDRSLRIDLVLENVGPEPMPAGLGLHPYFPKAADTVLRAGLEEVWLGTDDCIPITRVAVPKRWDFRSGRPLDDLVLDHCFGRWNRAARIEWPARGLALDIRAEGPLEHAVIYAPAGQGFFCFEPVSNANDAFNLAERGVADVGFQELAPGQQLAARVTFAVERL
jgi:aldose 1-epimerase